MSILLKKLSEVHFSVHFLAKKKTYSTGLYLGGVKLSEWKDLSGSQQNLALSKEWYLRWSYRNPSTEKMERQTNIKGGVNYYKTKSQRVKLLKIYERNLEYLLDNGYSPYDEVDNENESPTFSIKEAFDYALELKKKTVGSRSYQGYYDEIEKFKSYLEKNKMMEFEFNYINKFVVNKYLNTVLKKTSPRTRNNARSNLSAVFTVLKDNFIIDRNFIKDDIPKLETKSKVDRTIPNDLLLKISEHLKKIDPYLLLYIKFVAYNFLRPVEVNRLVLKNIDLKEKRLYFYPKNKSTKIKRIPDIMIDELKAMNLDQYDQDFYLFTPYGTPGEWNVPDKDRQKVMGNHFRKKVKDKFGLEDDYGFYSFRHSFITNLFRTYRSKGMSFNEAVDTLMPITGHDSKEGLKNYIHRIDADIPEDWSDDIEIIL